MFKKMVGLAGFEPATSQSEAGYPIQTRLQAQLSLLKLISLNYFKKNIDLYYSYLRFLKNLFITL